MHIQGYKPVTTTKSKLAQELVFFWSCFFFIFILLRILYSHSRFAFFFSFRSCKSQSVDRVGQKSAQTKVLITRVPRTTINNAGNVPTQNASEANYLFSWERRGLAEFR